MRLCRANETCPPRAGTAYRSTRTFHRRAVIPDTPDSPRSPCGGRSPPADRSRCSPWPCILSAAGGSPPALARPPPRTPPARTSSGAGHDPDTRKPETTRPRNRLSLFSTPGVSYPGLSRITAPLVYGSVNPKAANFIPPCRAVTTLQSRDQRERPKRCLVPYFPSLWGRQFCLQLAFKPASSRLNSARSIFYTCVPFLIAQSGADVSVDYMTLLLPIVGGLSAIPLLPGWSFFFDVV